MTSALTPIKYGRDWNYYKEFSISSAAFGGDSADGYISPDGYAANGMIPFSTYAVIITNEASAGSKIVEFSLNGTTIHGVLDGATTGTTRVLSFQNRVISKFWFRVQSGSTGPIKITVSAWSIR